MSADTTTVRQEIVAEAIVENKGKRRGVVAKAMRKAGYAPATIKNAKQNVLDRPGFKQIFAKYGLTEGLITRSLVKDIKAKPKKRIEELKLGAEILGIRKPAEPGSGGGGVNIFIWQGEPPQQSQNQT